ncbi:MAG: hypothetical protein MZU84_04130 [Sphingobacterium sp.]|nr:hypothetical protein [Sphingobacterium sp.]
MLQPSYAGSSCDYQHYDPPRDLSHLLPEHEFHHEFLDKVSAFSQIKALQRQGFDVYVNLCEGYRDSDVPSIDVIHALEDLNLPFTGPDQPPATIPPKDLMKLVALSSGVGGAGLAARRPGRGRPGGGQRACGIPSSSSRRRMATAWASTSTRSSPRPRNSSTRSRPSCPEFGRLLIEEYIDGREFTVLVVGGPDRRAAAGGASRRFEFIFPPGPRFKTYDLKVTQFHPECNVPCTEPALAGRLKAAAVQVFAGFTGEGYARMDFRVDAAERVFFLEANFACSVFYPQGYPGLSRLHPRLRRDRTGRVPARHHRRGAGAPCAPPAAACAVRPSSDGFAMFAARDLARGSVVFEGEGRPQRIVTRSHVDRTWPAADRDVFYRYAYPISPEVFVLWDTEPDRLGAAEPLVRPQHRVRRASTWWRGATSAAARS